MRVYLSGTFQDLIAHRQEAVRAIRKAGFDCTSMEDYAAADQRPVAFCLDDVTRCSLYIGLLAHRYGCIPPGEAESITALEYRQAKRHDIPALIFVVREDHPWGKRFMDRGENEQKLQALLSEVQSEHMVDYFTTPEDLAARVSAALARFVQSSLWHRAEAHSAVQLRTDRSSTHSFPTQSEPHSSHQAQSSHRISISHLPNTDLVELVGRGDELAILDLLWADPAINVVTLVGRGGIGKTSLIKRWLQKTVLAGSAARVYGYSFYRQNTIQLVDSADEFIAAALRWFGGSHTHQGTPQEKGERLAELIRTQRTLLVLDGIEPLQYPPGGPKKGELKDEALRALLLELVIRNNGLCILSTRFRLTDLKEFEQTTARRVDLRPLSPKHGAQLLTTLGVRGTQSELEDASREAGGDCLALTLLGTYLDTAWQGEIRERRRIRFNAQDKKLRGHAWKVMAAYEEWFADRPQMSQLLRLIGLFDRPADSQAIAAVREGPRLKGLTDKLLDLSEDDYHGLVCALREAKLIYEADSLSDTTIDTHPIVREFFGILLKTKHPNTWREGHNRLYEFLRDRAPSEFPETVEDMAPLYAAVAHACQAGRHQEALDEVYWRRILRGPAFFSTSTLGALGADLALLAGFFDTVWTKPVAALTQADQAFVLGQAAYTLWTLGHLSQMVPPQQAALTASISQENWINAASSALNLCDYYVTTGQLKTALDYADQSILLARRIESTPQASLTAKRYAQQCIDLRPTDGDRFLVVVMIASRGDILHCMGRLNEAEADFKEAERLQQEREPEFPLLYSVPGYWYSDLLLRLWKHRDVEQRAQRTLRWLEADGSDLLGLGLNYLVLGQALYLIAGGIPPQRSSALEHLNKAVRLLEQAGHKDYMPYGLIARAESNRSLRNFDAARADIEVARTIATQGNMVVHKIDCEISSARLHRDCGDETLARKELGEARRLMGQTGYSRRTPVPPAEDFCELV
jgi:tetratricopeptide (TPR) repeat protein